jgi:leucyl/phenylalanyl-tRNA---protein transferase
MQLKEFEIDTDLLWLAYGQGAFPMTDDDGVVRFYLPEDRAVFRDLEMHVSRSLKKVIERADYEVSFDRDFEGVVRGCFRDDDNWLSQELLDLYVMAHGEGWAHSCEIWVDGDLAGGLFGMAVGGVFSADSMFHRVTDMSKVALFYMLKNVKSKGFLLFDAQIMNSHTQSLGCVEILCEDYIHLRERALRVNTDWGIRQAASSSI